MEEGTALYRAGDVEVAAQKYRAALALSPDHAKANFNLGVILHGRTDVVGAVQHFRRALDVQPEWPAALINLGNALKDQGDLDGALVHYNKAREIDPKDPYALHNLGSVEFLRGNYYEAQDYYAAAIQAGREEARLGLANCLRELGRTDEALAHYETLLKRSPDAAEVYFEMGATHQRAGQLRAAMRCYSQAVDRDPNHVEAIDRWAALHMSSGDVESATPLYERVLALLPENVAAQTNLAKLAIDSADYARARPLLERALQIDPEFAPALWNMAHLELRAQRFEQAWIAYESRFRLTPPEAVRSPGVPILGAMNQSRAKRVGIRAEQGLGDQILFTTLLPEILAYEPELVIELDPKLLPIYRRCFPSQRWVERVPERHPPFEDCDFQIALGSLPGRFRPTLESFDRQPKSLLFSSPERRAMFAEHLEGGLNIGISWKSFQRVGRRALEELKSIPLERFSALPGNLIDLQYGDLSPERDAFDDRYPFKRIDVEGLDQTHDMEGLLAAIDLCDAVVTCCNVTAHLAGALGKRTYLLYLRGHPPIPFWTKRPDGRSLWYPSVEIVSDEKWTRWEMIFEQVASRLDALDPKDTLAKN